MSIVEKIAIAYIVAVNVITFALFGIDKLKAKKSKWRISEFTLLSFAFCGGSLGALAGMKVWHHKTNHKKFTILVPIFFVLFLVTCSWLLTYAHAFRCYL